MTLTLFCVLVTIIVSATASDTRITTAEAFVHLFEWHFQDIATECEIWLGPLGFKGVQISPPQEHVLGTAWWTRYQPVSYNLSSRSGNQEDLADMVRRCGAVGVDVYADIVFNHMASAPESTARGWAGSLYSARSFPAFQPSDFHHWNDSLSGNCAINNRLDRYNVQFCDFNTLPDLSTGSAAPRGRIASYISSLVDLGVKGLRLDSATLVPAADIAAIVQAVGNEASLFTYQEVTGSDVISTAEYTGIGATLEFRYPTEIVKHFNQSGGLQYLQGLGPGWQMLPSDEAVVFVDNHDLQRASPVEVLTYKNGSLYELAVIFMLAFPYGIPQLMSSYYFDTFDQGPPSSLVYNASSEMLAQANQWSHHDGSPAPAGSETKAERMQGLGWNGVQAACGPGNPWVCEHRWPGIATMVGFRRATAGLPVSSWGNYQGGSMIVFGRGSIGFVAVNAEGSPFSGWVQSALHSGIYQNILSTEDGLPQLNVTDSGAAFLELGALSAAAYLTSR